ncbi:MAG: rRNA maturation RNase YbeY [Actinobacteria bacterium]|nr:rRNA maturation RNase YbeY [Actinomycetota bacterium]MCL5444559.1 rRNA maturation RNase YbeY [Actinomycetota bacterium]
MAIDVYAADEQSDCDVELATWTALARAVLEDRGVKADAELSILFVDEPAIASLNEKFMDRDGPTDVLAFPIEDAPIPGGRYPDSCGPGPDAGAQFEAGNDEDPPLLIGDVVICPAVATRNATEHGVSLSDELALLVVHGILHLLGMDHEDDSDAALMEGAERQILERHYVAGRSSRPGCRDGDTADG